MMNEKNTTATTETTTNNQEAIMNKTTIEHPLVRHYEKFVQTMRDDLLSELALSDDSSWPNWAEHVIWKHIPTRVLDLCEEYDIDLDLLDVTCEDGEWTMFIDMCVRDCQDSYLDHASARRFKAEDIISLDTYYEIMGCIYSEASELLNSPYADKLTVNVRRMVNKSKAVAEDFMNALCYD